MKTVVGLFDDMAQAKKAALDLEDAGIPHDDISLVANNEGGKYAPTDSASGTASTTSDTTTSGHAIGHDALVGAEIGGVAGLLLGITGFAIPGLGWIAGAGWLMATILGAGTGAVVGGLVGALTHVGVPEADAAHYNEGVRRGGILVAVKAQDTAATQAAQILSDDGAVNIDERAAQYKQEGFTPSSTASAPYTTTPATPSFSGSEHIRSERSGIQTGGRDIDGSPDTRGISEKMADAVTGDRLDDKTGKPVV